MKGKRYRHGRFRNSQTHEMKYQMLRQVNKNEVFLTLQGFHQRSDWVFQRLHHSYSNPPALEISRSSIIRMILIRNMLPQILQSLKVADRRAHSEISPDKAGRQREVDIAMPLVIVNVQLTNAAMSPAAKDFSFVQT